MFFWYAGLTKGIKKHIAKGQVHSNMIPVLQPEEEEAAEEEIASNKVIRVINSLGPRPSITSDILMELNTLNVGTNVKQLRLSHAHKIFYNLCPSYLKEIFVLLKDVYQYNTSFSECNIWVLEGGRGHLGPSLPRC